MGRREGKEKEGREGKRRGVEKREEEDMRRPEWK